MLIRNIGRKLIALLLSSMIAIAVAGEEPAAQGKFPDDAAARVAIAEQARALVTRGEMKEVERIATIYRQQRTRTPGGSYALAFFQEGITRELTSLAGKNREQPVAVITSWLRQHPDSVFARIAVADVYLELAWQIRGTGFANTVPKEAWQGFEMWVKRAREHLEKNSDLAEIDPRWYVAMITVAKAQAWSAEETRRLVVAGLQKYPYYHPIYYGYLDFLLPRWHGDPDKLNDFIEWAIPIAAPSEGTEFYARLCAVAAKQHFKERLFEDSRCAWPRMKTGFEKLLQRYPDPYNTNNFARFACIAGDRATTRQLLARIDNAPVLAAWNGEQRFKRCADWAR